MEGIYEFDTTTCECAITEEEEQKIYEIPDEEEDYGPTFANPPDKEDEIYEVFKGKNVTKLHRKDIRYHKLC